MGKYDDALYRYLSDNDRFADLFNAVFFDGKEILRGELLQADSERYVTMIPQSETGEIRRNKSGFRDIKKRANTGESFVMTAIENQNDIDYAMPWRIMQYDQMEYGRQIQELQRRRRMADKARGLPVSRWKDRLERGDKLHPVYTICFYHGTDVWDGLRSLRDMMDFNQDIHAWQSCFHDYGMTLFCAGEPNNLTCFRTELKQLLEVLSLRKDKKKLSTLWSQEEFACLDRETAETMAVLTDSTEILEKLEDFRNEGGYNMCQAVDEMRSDWKAEGKAEFILQLLYDKGEVSGDLTEKIMEEKNFDTLNTWFQIAVRVKTVQQFAREAGIELV